MARSECSLQYLRADAPHQPRPAYACRDPCPACSSRSCSCGAPASNICLEHVGQSLTALELGSLPGTNDLARACGVPGRGQRSTPPPRSPVRALVRHRHTVNRRSSAAKQQCGRTSPMPTCRQPPSAPFPCSSSGWSQRRGPSAAAANDTDDRGEHANAAERVLDSPQMVAAAEVRSMRADAGFPSRAAGGDADALAIRGQVAGCSCSGTCSLIARSSSRS